MLAPLLNSSRRMEELAGIMMSNWYEPRPRGTQISGTLRTVYHNLQEFRRDRGNQLLSHPSRRDEWVMGFSIPPFQRERRWTDEQAVAFVNSARRRLPLGTYTLNVTHGVEGASRRDAEGGTYYFGDYWLLDGLQRMTALQRFFDDEFPVEGARWSEIGAEERRLFLQDNHFPCYETHFIDEREMREVYDLMNFGGTRHEEAERALRP